MIFASLKREDSPRKLRFPPRRKKGGSGQKASDRSVSLLQLQLTQFGGFQGKVKLGKGLAFALAPG